jgi:hypothetical protein
MPYKDLKKKKENNAKYRKENRERIKEKTKEYREINEEKLKEKKKEYYERNKEQIKEHNKEYYENNKEQIKEYYENNKERKREYNTIYREKNKEQIYKQQKEYYDDKTRNAYESITSGHIIDRNKWDSWCDQIKRNADKNNHQYSTDFTNDVMFQMMSHGCYYCGGIANTIDRSDSSIDHTINNCVGCCGPCNISKGASDPFTFIRRSYYKARGEYADDITDVWYENKTKPEWSGYRLRAKKKGVLFELNKKHFDTLIRGDCVYCKRSPKTWFGIDRVIPSLGYVIDNVATCCRDCNVDKHQHDVDMTMERNERIAKRMDEGDIVLEDSPNVKESS